MCCCGFGIIDLPINGVEIKCAVFHCDRARTVMIQAISIYSMCFVYYITLWCLLTGYILAYKFHDTL